MEDEDDFWEASDVKARAINFEDDELSSHQFSKLGAELRANLGNNSSVGLDLKSPSQNDDLIPLYDIISEQAMENILLADSGKYPAGSVQVPLDVIEPNISITLRRLVLGRSCSLIHHKSLKSKTELLDGAISIGDGNVILMVVLFLVQTLKKKLVYQILSSRPIAVNHYISYLTIRMKIHEVTDLLTMLGRSGEAAIKQYQIIMESSGSSVDVLLNKLKNLAANHFGQQTVEPIQLKMLTDYIKLLEWQKSLGVVEIENKSVIQSLAHICTHHCSDSAGKNLSPQSLQQQQQIGSQQYDWTTLSIQASLKNWNVIETMFIKKNFLGRTTLSCSVPIPKVIARLSEFEAEESLLAVYLNQMSSSSQKLELAKKFKAYRVVIDCLVSQKDRQALTQYKMALHPQSDEYFYAENALRASTIKWKN
ncbi:vacuolar protein sorting 16B [Arctopsyche grandis]|uniref:vacuolar protein sorting 16B n=1 Tax=Arctopsyche grandis TaxID=121162 RepID=UPI00406D65CA